MFFLRLLLIAIVAEVGDAFVLNRSSIIRAVDTGVAVIQVPSDEKSTIEIGKIFKNSLLFSSPVRWEKRYADFYRNSDKSIIRLRYLFRRNAGEPLDRWMERFHKPSEPKVDESFQSVLSMLKRAKLELDAPLTSATVSEDCASPETHAEKLELMIGEVVHHMGQQAEDGGRITEDLVQHVTRAVSEMKLVNPFVTPKKEYAHVLATLMRRMADSLEKQVLEEDPSTETEKLTPTSLTQTQLAGTSVSQVSRPRVFVSRLGRKIVMPWKKWNQL